jgi:membrane protein
MPESWTPKDFLKRNSNFLYHVLRQANRDDCWGMASEVAFQSMFALFQALFLVVGILSVLGANPDVFNSIIYFLGSFLPLELYHVIRGQVIEIAQSHTKSLLTLGLIGTLWTMLNLMLTLNKSFQRAYNVKETRSFWRLRLIAFGLAIVTILLIALILSLLFFGLHTAQFLETNFGYYNLIALLIRIFRVPFAFLTSALLVTSLYLAMSNVNQNIVEVMPGAIFYSTLWFLFTFAFGAYLRNFPHYNTTYGTIGAFLILMIWMYLTALSLLMGSELNAEIHRRKLVHNR